MDVKKMRKLLRNKKALSTVISTVLMIMVVMIGMSVAFSYVIFYSNGYQKGIGSSVLESVTVEDIWVNPDGSHSNQVNITLYNAGTAANLGTNTGMDVTVASVYVNGKALLNPVSNNADFKNYIVRAGNHITINGQLDQAFAKGTTYDIRIATVRGSNFDKQYTVPQ